MQTDIYPNALAAYFVSPLFAGPSPSKTDRPFLLTRTPTLSKMQNSTLHFCQSTWFNSTNCPAMYEAPNRCYTTSTVDIPAIVQLYSEANGGSAGVACTNPASTSGARKPSIARTILVIAIIMCLVTAAFGQPTSDHLGGHDSQLSVAATPPTDPLASIWTNARALSSLQTVMKRDVDCGSFKPEGEGRSTTSTFSKVSPQVNCMQAGQPCAISVAKGQTATHSSEFYLSNGGSVKGVDVGATFGGNYTKSYSSAVIYTAWVPVGQCGFLQTYSEATLFNGTYTKCSDGVEKEGTAVVVRDKLQLSSLVIVTC